MSVSAGGDARADLDSHADTCAFGKHCYVLSTYSESVNVTGFHKSAPPLRGIRIACVAVAYDCHLTHETFILVFDQVLYIPDLETALICPDQLRDNGVTVNDTPLLRLEPSERSNDSHSIIEMNSGLRIPLMFDKPISYFHVRKPTQAEATDDLNHNHVCMTSSVEWRPYDVDSAQAEASLRQQVQGDSAPHRIASVSTSTGSAAFRTYNICELSTMLETRQQATLSAVRSNGRSYVLKPDQLARRWRISIEAARRTLEKTTQRAVRDWSTVTGSRRFRPTQFQLEYPRLRCDVHVDIKKGPCRSIDVNTHLAVYATKFQWARAYGLRHEKEVHESLKRLSRDVGFPRVLRPDHAQSLTQGEFRRIANKAQVPILPHEPYNPNQNLAEDTIREAVRMYHRFMSARDIPKAFWDRVFIYILELRSHIALGHPLQEGENGATIIKGETSDISHLVDFSIYDWCWALSPTHAKQENKQLCRWLGPSFDVGGSMCFVCVSSRGTYLHRTSVIPLSTADRNSDDIKGMKRRFTEDLTGRLKEKAEGIKRSEDEVTDPIQYAAFIRPLHDGDGDTPRFDRYEDDDMETFEEPPSEEDDPAEFNKFVGARIRENEDGIENFGVVKGRKRDAHNNFIGKYHANQYLDTSIYEVEFEDKRVEYYRANEIVEALLMNIDDEGNTLLHVREIVDHRRDGSAVRADDGMITINGRQKPRRTTKGWEICVEVQGGETEWIDLKTAKESYPVLVAEYAVANKLVSEPAFAWWVPYTLKKRDRVLKAVNRRALTRKSEKFGLEVPSSGPRGVKRAYEIDGETGTEYWGVAMKKEVGTVLPALKVLEPNESVPPGFVRIDLMTVFDVKMDLTRKARICARGDQTDPPLSVTYASVVTRESIRIGFTIAALNGRNILSPDISGAYLNAPCAEKVYTVLGKEFGDLEGRRAIIVKALYGLKSSGFSWRSTLARTLREEMHFIPCRGDQDVWRREAERADGSGKYYEYLFVYTDDIVAISENPKKILDTLGGHYLLKPDSIGEPKTFLGATISKHIMDGTDYHTWAIGSKAYLVEALRVVKQRISQKKYNLQLKRKVSAPLPSGYKPELDGTKEVDDETAIVYMQFIGILRWLVELGRIDVAAEVSMMSACNAMPRMGHFHAVLHVFAYLKNNLDWELAMDC